MIWFTTESKPYTVKVPSTFAPAPLYWMLFVPESSIETVWDYPAWRTVALHSGNLLRGYRRWTEEDLRIFAEEDELDPERAQRLRAFLRGD